MTTQTYSTSQRHVIQTGIVEPNNPTGRMRVTGGVT